VVILDSLEHLRGTADTADAVRASVQELFFTHASRLGLPNTHMVMRRRGFERHPDIALPVAAVELQLLALKQAELAQTDDAVASAPCVPTSTETAFSSKSV
jgi:hypothetical protein